MPDRQNRTDRRRPSTVRVRLDRLRRRFRSSRPFRRAARSRAVAIAVALCVAIVVLGITRDARTARDAWGATASVAVATSALSAGEIVGPEDVRLEPRPAALAPEGALDELPLGRRASAAVARGEVLIADRVAPQSTDANGAVLAGDAALVSVPRGTPFGSDGPALSSGDRIDLYAAAAGGPAFAADAPAVEVATDAVVHEVRGDDVTLRIKRSEARAVAGALSSGSLTLVVVG